MDIMLKYEDLKLKRYEEGYEDLKLKRYEERYEDLKFWQQ